MPRDDDPIPLHDEDVDDRALTLEELARREAEARKKAEARRAQHAPRRVVVDPKKTANITRAIYLRGTGLIAAFALAGCILWVIATWISRRDLFYLAPIVGIAAGIGARQTKAVHPALRALIASVFTIVLLIVARLILAKMVLIPASVRDAQVAEQHAADEQKDAAALEDYLNRDGRVARIIAIELLRSRGINKETADPAEFESQVARIMPLAMARMASIDQSQYLALLKRVEADEIRTELIKQKLDGQLRAMGLNPDFQKIYPEQNEAAMKVVTHDVDEMTPPQQRAELKKLNSSALDEIDFKMRRSRGEDRRPSPKLDEPDIPTVAEMLFSFSFLATLAVAVVLAFVIGLRE